MPSEAIQVVYERAFRSLLWRLRPRSLQRGVELLLRRAMSQATPDTLSPAVLQKFYARTRDQTIRHLLRRREWKRNAASSRKFSPVSRTVKQTLAVLQKGILPEPAVDSADFHCDSGLGGLARWLRAAGYDARFWPYIDDSELVVDTMGSSAILLTTDEPLMDRSAIVWGVIPALLVPLNVGKYGQFSFVAKKLSLPQKQPRCMSCGGELATVEKESVRERIPPRTYPWLDEYFECRRCGQLFWPGTHWQNVAKQLRS